MIEVAMNWKAGDSVIWKRGGRYGPIAAVVTVVQTNGRVEIEVTGIRYWRVGEQRRYVDPSALLANPDGAA